MNIDNNFFWYPALLFPAIPIMLLVFTNKYTALAMLIRKLHIMSQNNEINNLSAERIQILASRMQLLRWMQTFSSISFLFNLVTIFCGFVGLPNYALIFFIISVIFLILAMSLFIIESQQSHYALSLHIQDLEVYNKDKISTN
ncbi:MAG: hypothetical protein CMQ85_05165 [Gammaproteobacteria bacterium]|nr:hypothetical protein [Gammaproteobacteria bacterium]|tara:strand:- start:589 stop:1017 length:429 start_codon:yes stop_codon:yes gene_type:complete